MPNIQSLGRKLLTALATTALVWACAPGLVSDRDALTGAPVPLGQGRLVVDLVDAPNRDLKEIWVTISKVTAHSASAGWVTVMNGNLTVDLLKLKTVSHELGFTSLPAGKITQIRLYLAEAGPQYVVLPDGTQQPLKVPSGVQSGIKIKGPFDLNSCSNSVITLDFDGIKSVEANDRWILRPVIHAKHIKHVETTCSADAGTDDDRDDDGDHGGDHQGGGRCDGGSRGDHPGFGGGSGAGGAGGGVGGADAGQFEEGSGNTGGAGGTGGGAGQGTMGGAGSACTVGTQCLSNSCANGVCQLGGAGSACKANTDCTSASCNVDGICDSGNAGGTGSACFQNSDCLSQTCVNQLCEAGNQGAPCTQPADCATGFSCTAGQCQVVLN